MESADTSPPSARVQGKWWAILALLLAAILAAVVVAFRLSPRVTPLLDTIR